MPVQDAQARSRSSGVTTRQMEIDEIGPVYHLVEELFTSEEFPILYRTWDAYEVTDHFTSDPDYCLAAEMKGKVVGLVLATTIEKEGTAWKRYGHLSWVGVAEDLQRTNLGLRLYKRLEESFREDGVRMVIADTEANNKGAKSLFQAIGFSLSRRHVWLTKTFRRPAEKVVRPRRSPQLTGQP